MPRLRIRWIAITALIALQACSAGPAVYPSGAFGSPVVPTPIETPDVLAIPSLDGAFAVDKSGRKLRIQCYGQGDPTVFLESGGGAIDEFSGASVVRLVAGQRRVCLYNRAGRSPSDPAPNRPREAEDVASDFHALTRAAGITPPFVLFGRSFGGMVVTFYASKYPKDVAGVVVFDSPAPNAKMTREQFPEGVWNYPGNVEHLNVLTGFENRFGKTPVHIAAPLILISPTHGESTPDDRYWLQVSPDSRQIVLDGGTEVIDTAADKIAEAILSMS